MNEVEYKVRSILGVPIPDYLKDLDVFTDEDDKPINVTVKPKKNIDTELDDVVLEDNYEDEI